MLSSLLAFLLLQQSDDEVDAEAGFGSGERGIQPVECRGENRDRFGFSHVRESVTAPSGEVDMVESEVRFRGFVVAWRQKRRSLIERAKRS